MSHQCFDVTIDRQIAHIVLNRPEKRTSMIPAFWDELPAIIEDIDNHARARVIVISSTGPHFSSGIDTAMFSDSSIAPDAQARAETLRQHGARFYDTVQRMQRSFSVLESCRIPVLAAIPAHLPSLGAWIDGVHPSLRHAVRVRIGEKDFQGIANLGIRPTVSHDSKRVLEVHLFEFDGDLYGMDIEVEFLRFVRGEKKFDSLDDLRAQIEWDIAEVRM